MYAPEAAANTPVNARKTMRLENSLPRNVPNEKPPNPQSAKCSLGLTMIGDTVAKQG